MKTGPLYLKLRECKKKIIVLQGGGDAAKTVTALQHIATDLTLNPGWLATVEGISVPNLRGGALYSYQKYVLPDFQQYISNFNTTLREYYWKRGSKMEFKSFQDELRARGGERDILFMNECNGETWETFWQLQRKTRKYIILDYNPTSAFWVHEHLLGPNAKPEFRDLVQLYIVDHRHNPYLTQEEHDAYENISDPDLFKVYARGQTGKVKGLILAHFKKWNDEFPTDCTRIIWGIDYGYTNDPTAITKIGVGPGRRRVVKECSYSPGLGAQHIKDIFLFNGLQQHHAIYSEADPNMINQLRQIGLPVASAIKGPGSRIAGLSKLREYDCYYTADSINFEKEIMSYKWMTAQDIMTGKEVTTNVPVDGWDHCADSARMAIYTDSFRNRTG